MYAAVDIVGAAQIAERREEEGGAQCSPFLCRPRARELRQLCSRFFLANGVAVDPARCALAQICAQMERYTRVKVIGKGAFGAAILVHARGDRRSQYVIKHVDVTRLDAKQRDEAKKEIKLLASFKHPNIVRYRDSFVEAGALHIVMDYAEGGDLHNLLKSQNAKLLPEDKVLDYFTQLCLAMKHVHDRKVLHRDIKSQNIFLTNHRKARKVV